MLLVLLATPTAGDETDRRIKRQSHNFSTTFVGEFLGCECVFFCCLLLVSQSHSSSELQIVHGGYDSIICYVDDRFTDFECINELP